MATTAINTLRFARKLKETNLSDAQAEGMVAAFGKELTEHLGTSAGLPLVKWMLGFNLAFSMTILWPVLS